MEKNPKKPQKTQQDNLMNNLVIIVFYGLYS